MRQTGDASRTAAPRFASLKRLVPVWFVAGLLPIVLGGCAGGNSGPPQLHTAAHGPACLDDSQRCVSQRQSRLKIMRADRSFGWVFDPDSRAHYATGVKLFAYDRTRTQMNCEQLAHGISETRDAKGWLQKPQRGISGEQLIRARLLNDDVHKRLRKTHSRKGCRRIANKLI